MISDNGTDSSFCNPSRWSPSIFNKYLIQKQIINILMRKCDLKNLVIAVRFCGVNYAFTNSLPKIKCRVNQNFIPAVVNRIIKIKEGKHLSVLSWSNFYYVFVQHKIFFQMPKEQAKYKQAVQRLRIFSTSSFPARVAEVQQSPWLDSQADWKQTVAPSLRKIVNYGYTKWSHESEAVKAQNIPEEVTHCKTPPLQSIATFPVPNCFPSSQLAQPLTSRMPRCFGFPSLVVVSFLFSQHSCC